MPVLISDRHLKAGDTRQTYSDTKQKGCVLRTTPNGVFTFYYQAPQHGDREARLAYDWHTPGLEHQPSAQRGDQAHRASVL
jgi:hypothetical protein